MDNQSKQDYSSSAVITKEAVMNVKDIRLLEEQTMRLQAGRGAKAVKLLSRREARARRLQGRRGARS